MLDEIRPVQSRFGLAGGFEQEAGPGDQVWGTGNGPASVRRLWVYQETGTPLLLQPACQFMRVRYFCAS